MALTGVARRAPSVDVPELEAVAADAADVDAIAPARFTHVVYAAGVTSDFLERPHEIVDSQIAGVTQFLDALRPEARFAFVSSTRVYGRSADTAAFTEESPAVVAPMALDNLYDSAKRFAESLCLWH